MTFKKYKLLKELGPFRAGTEWWRNGMEFRYHPQGFYGVKFHLEDVSIGPDFDDYFEEIEFRWTPEAEGDDFFVIRSHGKVSRQEWGNYAACRRWHELGNCFRTIGDAEEGAKVIKEALDKLHEKLGY